MCISPRSAGGASGLLGKKAQIVREAQRPGAMLQEVARRHGLHPSLLTRWRAQSRVVERKAARREARLLPVRLSGGHDLTQGSYGPTVCESPHRHQDTLMWSSPQAGACTYKARDTETLAETPATTGRRFGHTAMAEGTVIDEVLPEIKRRRTP